MSRAAIAGIITLALSLCCCCPSIVIPSPDSTRSPTTSVPRRDPTESQKQLLYRDFLNMETPAGASDFSGDGVIFSSPFTLMSSLGFVSNPNFTRFTFNFYYILIQIWKN